MAFSTFSGPVRVGPIREGAGRNTGLVTLVQSYDTGTLGTTAGTTDVQIGILPQGAQITNVFVDQISLQNGTSLTTTISVGSASGGAQFFAATATTAGGRFPTAVPGQTIVNNFATAAASADLPIWVRVVIAGTVGGGTTAGRALVTVQYVQRASNGAQNPASA